MQIENENLKEIFNIFLKKLLSVRSAQSFCNIIFYFPENEQVSNLNLTYSEIQIRQTDLK